MAEKKTHTDAKTKRPKAKAKAAPKAKAKAKAKPATKGKPDAKTDAKPSATTDARPTPGKKDGKGKVRAPESWTKGKGGKGKGKKDTAEDEAAYAESEKPVKQKKVKPGSALVVVESPAKARTIGKYLGAGFTVKASVGHVKDLPKSKIGVDVENKFEPVYEVIDGKKKVVAEIRKVAREVEKVYLASDPDREGEAIAWHIAEELKPVNRNVQRVLIHEITKKGVAAALQAPLPLDMNKAYAQQTRRILDRLVGYEISPILWNKVQRGLSAGRVQSVAVRLVVEREDAIRAFVPEEYWSVEATWVRGWLRRDAMTCRRAG